MNYIIWRYIFGFFLIASLIFIPVTIFLSVRYRLISLIKSEINIKKDEKKFQNNMYFVDRIIDTKSKYSSDSSKGIKQIYDNCQNISHNCIKDNTDITSFEKIQNNNDITELIQETDSSDQYTQIIGSGSNTKTDDISSENTVPAYKGTTSTIIVNNHILINNCKNPAYESFIMVKDIKIINGKTSEIKKFR